MTEERRKQAGHQMQIRFPEGSDLREWLNDRAREKNRSLTAEIIHRLEISRALEMGYIKELRSVSLEAHDDILADLTPMVYAMWKHLGMDEIVTADDPKPKKS